ncbi:MAG TPA: ParB/Srx family N-terminal domain-containing protein [Candidatus Rifleibacterium sp.]|nr:ParB/Srx family N-terminal domain-containing protein [Candidatus Rifleibacterium sp.]
MKISEIPISQLVRLLPEALCTPSDALQASVARHGVLAAPVVCDGILCDGHRRLSAARKAGITSLMCRETT